jgi:hypothetical protein
MQSRIAEGYRGKRTNQFHHRDKTNSTQARFSGGTDLQITSWLARCLAGPYYYPTVELTLKDMSTWIELIGHAQLRSFVDDDGHFWLEQNAAKKTKWAKLARDGDDVAWEFAGRGGSYTGRMLIDGELYTPSEATKKFLKRDG